MNLWQTKGSIAPGKDADLVLLDQQDNILQVYTRGLRV